MKNDSRRGPTELIAELKMVQGGPKYIFAFNTFYGSLKQSKIRGNVKNKETWHACIYISSTYLIKLANEPTIIMLKQNNLNNY